MATAHIILIALSGLLSIVAIVPYLRDILGRATKPRILTWAVWTFLTATVAVESFSEGAVASGWLAVFESIATGLVVVAGFYYGDRRFTRLDLASFVGVLVGIAVWLISGNAAWGIYISLAIDFMGGIPTIVHCWKKPGEETLSTFVISALGAGCALLAVGSIDVVALIFPLYLTAMNALFSGILVYRRAQRQVTR